MQNMIYAYRIIIKEEKERKKYVVLCGGNSRLSAGPVRMVD